MHVGWLINFMRRRLLLVAQRVLQSATQFSKASPNPDLTEAITCSRQRHPRSARGFLSLSEI